MSRRRGPTNNRSSDSRLVELVWYARLRWIAGLAILLGAAVGRWAQPPGWAESWPVLAGTGVVVLAYSAILSLLIGASSSGRPGARVRAATAVGIGLDLVCIAAIAGATGGLHSPAIGLFVLHMVFVSLLMRLHMSYVAALAAVALVAVALGVTDEWPSTIGDWVFGAGWAGSLILVAYVTDHIAGSLRSQDERLREHQRTAAQQEKMTALGRMTAGVAHEIANPLSNMDGILQLVQRRPESWNAETAASLGEQVHRIKRILQQMTTFAHPDQTGRERVALDRVVGDALSFVRFDKRLKGVELQTDLCAGGADVELNPHALQQVIINLVTNALDALDGAAGPRLEVSTARDADRCLVRVADNGPGMTPEVGDRVFDPFFTTKPVGYGTGLGLSISYRLVEQMGGRIDLETAPGAGAAFVIDLPIAEADSTTRDSPGR